MIREGTQVRIDGQPGNEEPKPAPRPRRIGERREVSEPSRQAGCLQGNTWQGGIIRTAAPAVVGAVTGPNQPTRRGTKVLIVDDDPIALQAALRWLTRVGYQVYARDQALGTANWVAAEKPDFVILDVCMPALPGGDLAQLMHRHRMTFESAVILYSGMDKDELAALASQSGAVGFIQKGSSGPLFLRQFEEIVAQHRAKSLPQ